MRRLKSWNIEYNFKWNQPCLSRFSNLSRGLNSLNWASGYPHLSFRFVLQWYVEEIWPKEMADFLALRARCYYITINWLSDREYITVGNSDWKLMLALNLANRWRWLTQDLVCVFECVYVGKPFEMCGERERGELSHNLVDRTQGYWPPEYNHATSS